MKKTANELLRKANPEDAEELRRQLNEIDDLWDRTSRLCERRANRLKDALRDVSKEKKTLLPDSLYLRQCLHNPLFFIGRRTP